MVEINDAGRLSVIQGAAVPFAQFRQRWRLHSFVGSVKIDAAAHSSVCLSVFLSPYSSVFFTAVYFIHSHVSLVLALIAAAGSSLLNLQAKNPRTEQQKNKKNRTRQQDPQ